MVLLLVFDLLFSGEEVLLAWVVVSCKALVVSITESIKISIKGKI